MRHVKLFQSKFLWGQSLSKAPDSGADLKDAVKNCNILTLAGVFHSTNKYLGNGLNLAHLTNRIITYLNLQNSPDEKIKFHKLVRSKMTSEQIQVIIGHSLQNRLNTKKEYFSQTYPNCDDFYYCVTIALILTGKHNQATKAFVQVLRNKIANSTSTNFKHDVLETFKDVKSTHNLVTEMGKTHKNLLSNTFYSLLTAPNTIFQMLFYQEKMKWEVGKPHTFSID